MAGECYPPFITTMGGADRQTDRQTQISMKHRHSLLFCVFISARSASFLLLGFSGSHKPSRSSDAAAQPDDVSYSRKRLLKNRSFFSGFSFHPFHNKCLILNSNIKKYYILPQTRRKSVQCALSWSLRLNETCMTENAVSRCSFIV